MTQLDTRQFIGKILTITIDRPMNSVHPKHGFVYPINYGYLHDVISGDGEELDAYVLGINRPLETFSGECIAVIHRLNDDDDKLVIVKSGATFGDEEICSLTYFQEQWFQSEIWR
jgi:inorganic pyrophosphatase